MVLLSDEQIKKELQSLSGWSLQGNEIAKSYKFKNFVQAIGFVNSVAILSEKMDHHPDIDIRWNNVILTLSTHSEGGLTDKDFTLAKEIDKLV